MISFFGEPLGRGLFNAPRRNLGFPASMNQEVLQSMYAIIAAGGKQYRVSQGDTIYIEKVDQEDGSVVTFDVLAAGEGAELKVGTPVLDGAKVEGKVVKQVKGEKIIIGKYKSKKNYDRKTGHRQPYTKVEITAINA